MNSPSKQKPRVMEVITRLIRGGAQETTILIVRRLLKEGYQVVFAHGPGDESLLKMLPTDNPDFEALYIPEFRRRILPYYDFLAFWRIYRYLKKNPVDLVHTHTSKAGVIGRWAAHLANTPVIVHSPRGSIYHETYFNQTILNGFAFIERMTGRFTDMIVTLCESEKKDYLRYRLVPPEKFTTIYSGVEIERYVDCKVDIEKKKQELKLPSGVPLVGYVARLTPEKGHLLCLDALPAILKEVPEAKFVFVGGGPLENEVKKKVQELGVQKSVYLIDSRTDVQEVLRVFDCCLQFSLWDGLPRAMIEAMLAEKPVIATPVGGIPEIIHHQKTGLLIGEKDVSGLSRAVIELLQNAQKREILGRNARRRMEEVFDVDVSVEKLFALYEAMIASKKNRTRG